MINQIKSIVGDLERNNIDTLILAKVNLQSLYNGYDEAGVEVPEWIVDGINTLNREVTSRNRAALEATLKKMTAQREALASVTEKRNTLDKEIKSLQNKLQ